MDRVSTGVIRIESFAARHRRAIVTLQWLSFAVSCASFAGFVTLPGLVIPAYVGVVATMVRYAIWGGLLKPWLLRRREVETR